MKLGSSEVLALRLGSDEVVAAYLGAVQVWPTGFYFSGSLSAESELAGGAGVRRTLVSSLPAHSVGLGAIGVLRVLAGDLLATSAFSGSVDVFEEVIFSGALEAASGMSGLAAVKRALSGALQALAAFSATMGRKRAIAGAGAAAATFSGAISRKRALVGTAAANAALSGALTVTPSGVTSLSFQTSAASAASTVTCPTVEAGDIGILWDCARNITVVPTNVVPSGFTQLQTTSGGSTRSTMSYKVFDGSEDGASLSGMTGPDGVAKILLVLRPNGAVSSVATSTFLQETTNGDPASQLIAASGQPSPLVRLAGLFSGSGAPTFSAGTFGAQLTQGNGRFGYTIQNSSPTNDTVDTGDIGSQNTLVSGWMRFS